MNAKELRKAAEEILERVDIGQIRQGTLAARLAEYILATVRDDDNEPVTVEGLVALGFKLDEFQGWYVSPNDMLWWTPEKYGSPAHWRVGGAYVVKECEPRNMKEARELLERCGAIGKSDV